MSGKKEFPPLELALHLEGKTALILHSPEQLADKQHPVTRAIQELTDKGSKITDADQEEIDRLRFVASLYHDPELGLYLPTWNLIAAMNKAATVWKLGIALVKAVLPTGPRFALTHDAPRDPLKMWAKPEFRFRTSVGINRGRIVTVRPILRRWAADVTVILVQEVMNFRDFERIAQLAGQSQGLGDARKLGYGRFSVTITPVESTAAA